MSYMVFILKYEIIRGFILKPLNFIQILLFGNKNIVY